MAQDLYEVGLIKNGIPSLRIAFLSPEELTKMNPLLLSGFIQVLNDFVDSTFEDTPKRLEMSKFIAHFTPIVLNDNETRLILYFFTSPECGKQSLEPIMDKISKKLETLLSNDRHNGKTAELMERVIFTECQPLIQTSHYSDKLKYF